MKKNPYSLIIVFIILNCGCPFAQVIPIFFPEEKFARHSFTLKNFWGYPSVIGHYPAMI